MQRRNSVTSSTLTPFSVRQNEKPTDSSSYISKFFTLGYTAASFAATMVYGWGQSTFNWGRNIYYLNSKHRDWFILEKLYEDAVANGNFVQITTTPWLFSELSGGRWPYQLCVVTGSRKNAIEVGNTGENNGDPSARSGFDFLKIVMGRSTFLNELGDKAKSLKEPIRKHVANHNPLKRTAETARKIFTEAADNWNETSSLQDQMTKVVADIIGERVLGIPRFPAEYIPDLRIVGESLFDNQNKRKVQEAAECLSRINQAILGTPEMAQYILDELIAYNSEDRLDTDDRTKFILDDLISAIFDGVTDSEKRAELLQDRTARTQFLETKIQEFQTDLSILTRLLLQQKVASFFIVEGNTTYSIMWGMIKLAQHKELRERLADELASYRSEHPECKEIPTEDLRGFPELRNFILEVMRHLSINTAVVRQTSVPTEIKIEDNAQVKHVNVHKIPKHSVLFLPTQAMHYDERVWGKNPWDFNPDRFKEDPSRADKIMVFSAGKRQCVAIGGFVEVILKAIMAEIIENYDLKLLSEIQERTRPTLLPHWKQEYYMEIKPKGPEQRYHLAGPR